MALRAASVRPTCGFFYHSRAGTGMSDRIISHGQKNPGNSYLVCEKTFVNAYQGNGGLYVLKCRYLKVQKRDYYFSLEQVN